MNIIEISGILLLVVLVVASESLLLERVRHLEQRQRILTTTLVKMVNTLDTVDKTMAAFAASLDLTDHLIHLIVVWMQQHSISSRHIHSYPDDSDTVTHYGDYSVTIPTKFDPYATHPLPFDDDAKPSSIGGESDGFWGEPGTTEPMLSERLRVEPERLHADDTHGYGGDDDTDKLRAQGRPDGGAEGVSELLPDEHELHGNG